MELLRGVVSTSIGFLRISIGVLSPDQRDNLLSEMQRVYRVHNQATDSQIGASCQQYMTGTSRLDGEITTKIERALVVGIWM